MGFCALSADDWPAAAPFSTRGAGSIPGQTPRAERRSPRRNRAGGGGGGKLRRKEGRPGERSVATRAGEEAVPLRCGFAAAAREPRRERLQKKGAIQDSPPRSKP
ncbi:hypothetical protein TraAM80_06990, partial [Trypanosoma rangeli]